VVAAQLLPVGVSHIEAAAATLEGGLIGFVAGHAPLQGALQFVLAEVHELYLEHDLVLFLKFVALTFQLKRSK
jgi:hypothetical protein